MKRTLVTIVVLCAVATSGQVKLERSGGRVRITDDSPPAPQPSSPGVQPPGSTQAPAGGGMENVDPRTKARSDVASMINMMLSGAAVIHRGFEHYLENSRSSGHFVLETSESDLAFDGKGLYGDPTAAASAIRLVDAVGGGVSPGWAGHDVSVRFFSGTTKIVTSASSMIRFNDIYPQISLSYQATELEAFYEFDGKAGAKLNSIVFALDGGKVRSFEPQIVAGNTEVPARWRAKGGGQWGIEANVPAGSPFRLNIHFTVVGAAKGNAHGPRFSMAGAGYDATVDREGNIYVVGSCEMSAIFLSPSGLPAKDRQVYVAKIGVDDLQTKYVTYFGGSAAEEGPFSIAVARDGTVYVSGTTRSADFPRMGKQSRRGGGADVFVARIAPDGDLTSSLVFGGAKDDIPSALVLGPDGAVNVAGTTSSSDFPTQNPYATHFAGGSSDAFFAALAMDVYSPWLVYSTYVGGSGDDRGESIACDLDGYVYVGGTTSSRDFPSTSRLSSRAGRGGSFVVRFDVALPRTESLVASVVLNGDEPVIPRDDTRTCLGVDMNGRVYVISGARAGLPVTEGVLQRANQGGWDLYVARLSPDLASLDAATYFGGEGDDVPHSAVVDADGDVYVVGATSSRRFPMNPPIHSALDTGLEHVFILKLRPSLDEAPQSQFLATLDRSGRGARFGLQLNVDRDLVLAARMDVVTRTPFSPPDYVQRIFADGIVTAIFRLDGNVVPVIDNAQTIEGRPGWVRLSGHSFDKTAAVYASGHLAKEVKWIDEKTIEANLPDGTAEPYLLQIANHAYDSGILQVGKRRPRSAAARVTAAPNRPEPSRIDRAFPGFHLGQRQLFLATVLAAAALLIIRGAGR